MLNIESFWYCIGRYIQSRKIDVIVIKRVIEKTNWKVSLTKLAELILIPNGKVRSLETLGAVVKLSVLYGRFNTREPKT